MIEPIIVLSCLALSLILNFAVTAGEFFKPFNVSYDHRALIIDGKRRILISAGIHYPRATPQMWPDIISKSKEGGANAIQTYVFWSAHEPIRGQYNFEGRNDLVKFVKLVGSSGLYLHLRIGPYVCAEWNFGGFPVWLRDIPGIEFRTDNKPFKDEMQRFVKKIVDLMREEMLFSWQGGPIIMLQIENEYGDIEGSYGQKGKNYVKWAANMALGLGANVPWVMCQQVDAPENIIDACNGYYCDSFWPNSHKKPKLWTENWDGGFTKWGGRLPQRLAEDIAFAVARFYQREGSFQNYYMYFGGTNFGRTSGGPNYITSYDYDAPLDEYGVLRQPKWGHLKDLHAAIMLCEPALVAVDSPKYIKLGPNQEAHVYSENAHINTDSTNESSNHGSCAAFLANIDEHQEASVSLFGRTYTLPPWSVSILPDCRNTAFNTAKIGAQISVKSTEYSASSPDNSPRQKTIVQDRVFPIPGTWMTQKEKIGAWNNDSFTVLGLLEHLNVTKDKSDYLWYKTRITVSKDDISFWEINSVKPKLIIDSMRDLVYVFVNGKLAGSAVGHWVKVEQPLLLAEGDNNIILLSETTGLQNYGVFYEKDGAGFKGQIKLTGFLNGDIDISASLWTYQVGLKGERLQIYNKENNVKVNWTNLTPEAIPSTFSWYKAYFDPPVGNDPVALNLRSMGKGQAWVNGHLLGRYWTLVAPETGCQEVCDYRGAFNSEKCTTNCGKPTQIWYHIPRSWLNPSNNLLVIFEETGGNPFEISIMSYSTKTICAKVSEFHYPPLHMWSHPDIVEGRVSITDIAPEMQLQCDKGHMISSIEFASYGTPKGSCQKLVKGNCHAPDTLSVVSQACKGKNSCSIKIANSIFGIDPCHGVAKTLAVEAKCSPNTTTLENSVSDL